MRWAWVAAASVIAGTAHAGAPDDPPAPAAPGVPAVPEFGVGLLGGPTFPTCEDCSGALEGNLAAGMFVFFYPIPQLGLGGAADVVRTTWTSETWEGFGGSGRPISSTLTSAIVGLSFRYVPFNPWAANPYLQLTIGGAVQSESGKNFSCNRQFNPGVELGVGADGPITPWLRWDASLVATTAMKFQACSVADGPPPVPLVTPGAGLRVGVSFGKRT